MLRWLKPLLCLGICASLRAEVPRLVDRNAFFGEVQISSAQVSPDGKYISFLKPYKGTRNILMKKADEPLFGGEANERRNQAPGVGLFLEPRYEIPSLRRLIF